MVRGRHGRDPGRMEQHGIRRAALRGLLPSALTVAVVLGGIAGTRAGGGASALAVAALVAGVVALALGGLAAAAVTVACRSGRPDPAAGPCAASPSDDLAARWARVEPVWSGRR